MTGEEPTRPLLDGSALVEEVGGDLVKVLDAIVLKPGEYLVLTLPWDTTPEQAQDVQDVINDRPAFRHRVLIASEVLKPSVQPAGEEHTGRHVRPPVPASEFDPTKRDQST